MNSEQNQQSEQEELFEHFNITVDKGQEPLRIDKFLMNRIEKVSRNKIQNAALAESILVNEKPVKSSYKVRPKDEISVVFSYPAERHELLAEDIPLNILYEDDDLIVVDKQAGLVVHPGSGNYTGTLVNGLLHHFQNLPVAGDASRPGLIHRLDKDTSGVMVVAKTDYSMQHLAKQFFDRTTKRRYVALVWGDFDEEEGTVECHLGRHLRFRKKMDAYPEGEVGKHAITHYKVLERFGYVSLVECRLETGRTHQIRVHMMHMNHPVFNDQTYGGNRIVKGTIFTKYKQFVDNCFKMLPRQALHARSLGFVHPETKEEMYFESDLPDDMAQVIEKWRSYFLHAKK